MTENPSTAKVNTRFKDMLKLEAKSRGLSIQEYTGKLADANTKLDDISEEWKEKWGNKVKKKFGFDFP